MFAIRDIEYDSDEDAEKAFSRITWAAQKVSSLHGELISTYTTDTNRPWIGEYDKAKMSFGLIEPRSFFSAKYLQIVVRGRIARKGDGGSTINIKLKLGVNTFIVFLMIYVSTIALLGVTVVYGDASDIAGVLLWLLVFPVLGTVLLNRKLNSIERKIEQLFGIR